MIEGNGMSHGNHDTPHVLIVEARVDKLDERVDALDISTSSLVESRRTWRWSVGIVAPLVVGALLTIGIAALSSVSTSAERLGGMTATLEALKIELQYVRLKLDKLAGVDVKDDVVIASSIPAGSCGSFCSASGECRDFFGQCRFCYSGRCTDVLPADPPTPSPFTQLHLHLSPQGPSSCLLVDTSSP